jgi:hypothetical protein
MDAEHLRFTNISLSPPVSVLRDLDGQTLATIAKADVSKLVAAGWKPPLRLL